MSLDLVVILLYVVAQLGIGFVVSRRIRTEADYLLAGRRLGYLIATFTIFATWFGAETCIGAAGAIYQDGLSAGSQDPFGYAGCLLFMGLVFAVPLWRRGLTTLADLFRERFSQGVERLAVLIMVPTSVLWAAAQIRAFGQVLSASSDLELELCITMAAAVVTVYTVMGGLLADAVSDLIQGVVLMVGLAILGVFLFRDLGGPGEALAGVDPERLRFLAAPGASPLDILEAWALPICGSVVAQELVARVLASRSPRVARRSTLGATGIYLLFGIVPVLVGLVGPSLVAELDHPEQILPLLAREHLPRLLYLLFSGALVSAILSTVDSALLVSASLVSHNLVVSFRPAISESGKVRMARAAVLGFGLVAFALALSADDVHDLVQNASGFGSSGVFVIMVFGLFTGLGGPLSAFLALGSGVSVWIAGLGTEMPYPFLTSLACALTAYLVGAAGERLRAASPRSEPA